MTACKEVLTLQLSQSMRLVGSVACSVRSGMTLMYAVVVVLADFISPLTFWIQPLQRLDRSDCSHRRG